MSDAPAPKTGMMPAVAPVPRRNPLPLVVGVLNLAATGFLVFRSLTAPAAPAAQPPAEAPTAAAAYVEGPVVSLEPFVVNLRDEGVSRYLKATFELEVIDKKAAADLDKAKRVIRDEVLRYLSGLAVADTLGEDAKTKIQSGVLERVAKVVGPERTRRLFFAEFVVQ